MKVIITSKFSLSNLYFSPVKDFGKDIVGNDPAFLEKKNNRGLTPYDLLKANTSMDSSAKDKCLRLLKPGSTASELNKKTDELLKLRELLKRLKPIDYVFNRIKVCIISYF